MPHHNPFQYVKRIMETPEGRSHIRDASEFVRALRDGGLPSVAFVKPHWKDNAHAVSSTVGAGDRWVGEMVQEVMASRYWPRAVVVITYDEGGGWFDHVRPPVVDRFGLGTRVPALVVSPYARRGVVAHGQYEHASILKLIEWRVGVGRAGGAGEAPRGGGPQPGVEGGAGFVAPRAQPRGEGDEGRADGQPPGVQGGGGGETPPGGAGRPTREPPPGPVEGRPTAAPAVFTP